MTPQHERWTTASALDWTDWVPLIDAVRGADIPAAPGLYRIRRLSVPHLDYIGQTGSGEMTLRKRMAMLRGVYKDEMPYRDPHTAGPALWALRHLGHEFEASFAVVVGGTPWRKGLECVVLADHRQQQGRSPTVNFGRMPNGYRMSSANNQKIVDAGRRFRGGPVVEVDSSHVLGIPPSGLLDTPSTDSAWCGLRWSSWETAERLPSSLGSGLYRLRGGGQSGLAYIGEGAISKRVRAHLAKVRSAGHEQGQVLASVGPLAVSWVEGGWVSHQRLELENDLIASHVLVEGRPPAAQFLG